MSVLIKRHATPPPLSLPLGVAVRLHMGPSCTRSQLSTRDASSDEDTVHRLNDMRAKVVAEAIGMSERRVRDVLARRALPHRRNREALESLIRAPS